MVSYSDKDGGKQSGNQFFLEPKGFGDNESVQLALSATGPTITAAGLIFAFTFAAGPKMGRWPTVKR